MRGYIPSEQLVGNSIAVLLLLCSFALALDPVLERVLQLKARTYLMRDHLEQKVRSVGFISQEVESLFPETVDNSGEYKALAYDHFAVYAIAAIQEQQEIINKLEKQNNELKKQMEEQNKLRLQRLEKLEKINRD